MLEDPKVGLGLKRQIKEKFPTAQIRDLEIIDQVTKPYDEKINVLQTALENVQKEFSELKTSGETEKAEAKLRDSLASVRTKYSLTDDGMAKVIEAMRDRNLAHDPEAAAALIVAQMPKAKPTSSRESLLSPNLDIYGMQSATLDEKWATLHSKPWQFFNDEIISVIDEANQAA